MSRTYGDVTREGNQTFIGRRKKRRVTIKFRDFKVNGQSIGEISTTHYWDAASDVEFVLPEVNIVAQVNNARGGSVSNDDDYETRCRSSSCSSGCRGST